MDLFRGLFPGPSWQSFVLRACGWAWANDRHTITTSLWLTGATTVQHFSRFSVFLGCPLYATRWPLWGAVIRQAAPWVPQGEVMEVVLDDTTKKKAGTHLDGLARYRHGAGSARQDYRTLRGVNFVVGILRIPLHRWPGPDLSVPGGLERSLKPTQANTLHRPYRSRSPWARAILDFIAAQLPTRHIRSLADGGSATKDSVRALPQMAHAVGRCPVSAKLYQVPPMPPTKRRGAPRKQGALIGAPQTLAQTSEGWSPPPSEEGAECPAWAGLGHSVFPGRLLRMVVVRRLAPRCLTRPGQRKPPPPGAAFFRTDLSLSPQDILSEYRARWAVEIAMRDANAFDGLGQDQCRKRQHIVGVNTLRFVRAAARTRWCLDQVARRPSLHLQRYRPWDRQKVAPSQLDVVWACREALHEAGIFPIPRFTPEPIENKQQSENVFPLAA